MTTSIIREQWPGKMAEYNSCCSNQSFSGLITSPFQDYQIFQKQLSAMLVQNNPNITKHKSRHQQTDKPHGQHNSPTQQTDKPSARQKSCHQQTDKPHGQHNSPTQQTDKPNSFANRTPIIVEKTSLVVIFPKYL